MSDTAPLQLACRFCRPLVEGCPSVFEVTLTSIVAEPVRDIVLEFRCAGLRGGVAEKTLAKPLTAFETLTLDLDIDPERKGTPSMTVHLHASTSRGRFTAHGSVRPGGQPGISILERPADMQSLTVQIQEKAFFGAMFTEGGLDIGKVKTLNDFLQLHLPVPMEPVTLSWDGFPVARSLKPDGIFAGRFKLIEPLGQGGMGVVWLAEDTRLKGRQVALKFLPETVCHDPDAIDDLKRELLLSQELTHENIVRIHDLIEAEGTVAISMEYIRGKTLSALRREQPSRVFSTTQLLPWLQQLCAALDYAHGKGIIHHDLKPLNLMINEADVLKVCDFGLAGSMEESRSRHSRPGHTSGTTPYMSPQHLLLGSRTVSDDVYALGATLYELLTSKAPFYAGSIETQIERTPPPAIEERRAILRINGAELVPSVWEEVIQSCLDKKSEARPASAGAVHHELTRQPSTEELKKVRDEAEHLALEEKKRLATEAKREADQALKIRARNILERQRLIAEAKRQADEAAARQRTAKKKQQEEAELLRRESSSRQGDKSVSKQLSKVAAALAITSLGAWAFLSKPKEHIREVPKLVEDTASKREAEQQRQRANELEKKAQEEEQKRLAAEAAIATARADAALAPLGKIKVYVPEQGFAVIDAGRKSGLYQGLILRVRRNGVVVATIEVDQTIEEDEAVVNIKSPEKLQVGDDVIAGTAITEKDSGPAITPESAQTATPFINSLGMKFVPVPIGVGESKGQRVLFSIWETRSKDYAAFVKDSRHDAGEDWKTYLYKEVPVGRSAGEDAEESLHPVANVSHDDGMAFCAWLTKRDRASGLIGPQDEYRLPTDAEWSYAVGIGDKEDASAPPKDKDGKLTDIYPWGGSFTASAISGNYADTAAKAKFGSDWYTIPDYTDGYATTAPVGSFKANSFGIYDLGGNLWEWTSSEYAPGSASRVLRGGSWYGNAETILLSSGRYNDTRDYRSGYFGFRCVLVIGGG